jgi:hypothetical protein
MFAFEATFNAPARSKKAPMLADFLRFNSKQSKHYDIGKAGEKLAIAMLQDAGFKAYKPSYHGVDFVAVDRHTGEVFYIEVKTATQSEKRLKSWQFCLNKPKGTSLSHSDYVLLILIAESGYFTYLIPSGFLAGTKQFTISSHPEKYRGKIAPFRNRGSLNFDAANEVCNLAMLQ